MKRETIKELRGYLDMTQAEFSSYLGINVSTIAMIEAGHREISEATANKIAKKIDVNSPEFKEYRERRKNVYKFLNL